MASDEKLNRVEPHDPQVMACTVVQVRPQGALLVSRGSSPASWTGPYHSHGPPFPYFLLQISGLLPTHTEMEQPLGRQEALEKPPTPDFSLWHSSPQGPAIILSGVFREGKHFPLCPSELLAEIPVLKQRVTGKTSRSLLLITVVPNLHRTYPGKISNSLRWPKPPG